MNQTMPPIGIDDISGSTTSLMFPLESLAAAQGTSPGKYTRGIGQWEMSIPADDEDIVTLAAQAAKPIIARHGSEEIRTLLFATETGIDQSKAAGIYVHELLGLNEQVRVVELKEACYSATSALQFAMGLVARNPQEKVLVIASDIARYELDSSGEATQGAGAIAMLVAANPRIMAIEPASGLFTANVHDFWRPNDRSTALVDGKYSVNIYLKALIAAWEDYRLRGGAPFEEISRVCFHQPFTKMAAKAMQTLAKHNKAVNVAKAVADLEDTMLLNRRLGNSYTASTYMALLSLLEAGNLAAGERVGIFSYGSGAVAEFFTGVLSEGYQENIRRQELLNLLDQRQVIDYADYRSRHIKADRLGDYETAKESQLDFRFKGVKNSIREYEAK